jgi:hypothetical protein
MSRTRVATPSASRYLQQLAKHWSHKMEVAFTPEDATITFPDGSRLEMQADNTALHLLLTVPDDSDAARMQDIVARHIDRYAFREAPLTFDWQTPGGSAVIGA